MQNSIPAGTVLGDYEILSQLGSGGMGEVYRARDRRLDREVAIKVLPNSVTADPERLRRFEQEARAAAALNHPNILAVYQMGEYQGTPYIVSELLEGQTLRSVLDIAPIPIQKAINYALQIASGLAAAHDKGIVHRDIKPENLFIIKDGRLKILDFGLARLGQQRKVLSTTDQTLATHTEPGMLLGTVGYMSPEQVRGEVADHRSDIFAFGIVLYEMLTGKPTFKRATSVETMTAILNEEPPSISHVAAGTPIALQRVVQRCLDKNPAQRFQSASDLAFALESLDTSRHSFAPARKPLRLKAAIGATALVLALGLAVLGFLGTRSAPAPQVYNYTQLTHDGQQKALLGTDGARLYIGLASSAVQAIAAVPLSGGEPRPISVSGSPNMLALALSPNGGEILVVDGEGVPARGPFFSVPVLGGSPRRIGDLIGISGSWSADGKRLTYSNGFDLYVANADGTGARKVLAHKDSIFDPVFSPDGTRIRFSTSNDPGSILGQRSLWEVSADGSNAHQLFSHDQEPIDECCGRWTPDGRYYIYQSRNQIWVLPEPGRFSFSKPQPVQLTSSPMSLYWPVSSKEGSKLFVVGRTYRGELMRYDLKSGHFVPFLGGISAEYADFSRDGQWVAYTSYPEGTIWRSKLDGSERLQLTFPPMFAAMPRWSPDGKRIAFFTFPQSVNKPGRMYQIASDGGAPRELLPSDPHNQLDPNWSPDGTRIIFAGDTLDAAQKRAGIRILDLATSQVTAVPDSAGLFSPRYSPDGKRIAALTGNSSTLLLFDVKTQKWSELTKGSLGWLNFSRDGQYIYSFDFSGKGGVLKIHVPDGKKEKAVDLKDFVTTGRYGGSVALTPDGSPLLLRDTGSQDIYALDWKAP